ncbi:MAG: hypothetical protein Q7U03_14415 [Syntrophales bacterium]|nr:hypothetical protein [Syntrophales bacterium]
MIAINELDRVEILTLQDNYIDMTATDNSEMIHRAGARVNGEIRKSVLAEHGFSAGHASLSRLRGAFPD